MNYFNSLFSELNKNGIHYSVLRNWETLPDSSGGHDIDIWVRKEDLKVFLYILESVANDYCGEKVSCVYSKDCPRYIYMGNDWGIQYDVHVEDAQYRNAAYMKCSIIDNHTSIHNGVRVLDSKIDGLISFFKEILNNGTCKKEYCENASRVIEETDNAALDSYLDCFSGKTRTLLVETLKERDYSSKRLIKVRKKCVSEIQSISSISSYYMQRLVRIWNAVSLFGSRTRPGYVIAVMGTDGSGKSTIIESITPWLDEAFHHGVTYKHLRPTLFKDLGVLVGKRKAEPNRVVTNPHAHKPSGLIGSLVKWSYYLLDYILGYFKTIWPQVSFKCKLFIFDRYYYDYYIDQRRLGISLPKWLIRIGEVFVPKPDLVICLGGDTQKIYERKPETSLDEVSRQVNALQVFCAKRKNAVWVDTTVTPEQSIAASKKAILEMMGKRFSNKK
ncbi:MAG: hypothetical protein IKW86_05040 [Salinivirgaceae bacterium]|nr:hypothetical protein [Salinivirgaceae bacterium]